MKKLIALLLVAVMCLSLAACGGEKPSAPAEGNDLIGDEKAFLVEHLSEYIQSDAYLQREKDYEDIFGEARDFTVTRVIEVFADGLGANNLSVHFLAVKADCDWAIDGDTYCDILLVADYNTGILYDVFAVDDSWQYDDGSIEQQIWYMLHGTLVGSGYKGGTILIDSETRTELSGSDIAEINQALASGNAASAPAEPEKTKAALENMVLEGSGQYTVVTEYPELFTRRVLDDGAIAALKDAAPEKLREEISTPADFTAWLDTQETQYFSNVTSSPEGLREFGANYALQWYETILSTPIAASLALYILGDDIPNMGMVAVNMDYEGGTVLCGNVIPVDGGYYVFSLDTMSRRWQQASDPQTLPYIMKEVFPLLQITGLRDLIGFCGSEDDISCPGAAVIQAFYFPMDTEVALDCSFGCYAPQNPENVLEFYRDEEFVSGAEERTVGHIKPEYIDRYEVSHMLGGTTLTAEEAYALLDMEPEEVKERVKTVGDVLMYMLAARIGDCGGDRCAIIDGQEWHYNLNVFEAMEQRQANCGASANLANYLLEGDYEGIGFILHAYYMGNGGGHVYNYIRYEGKYYIVDLSWFIFGNYLPENDFPVMELDRLEDYGKRISEIYGGVCMAFAHTSPGQHFPNVFDDANSVYAIPAGTEYMVLYQETGPGCYRLAEYPLDQNKLDWTVLG